MRNLRDPSLRHDRRTRIIVDANRTKHAAFEALVRRQKGTKLPTRRPLLGFVQAHPAVLRQDVARAITPVRVHNRCLGTGYPRSVLRRYRNSRMGLLTLARSGYLPSVKKRG